MLSSLVFVYTVYKEVKFMQKHLVTYKVFGDLLSTYPLTNLHRACQKYSSRHLFLYNHMNSKVSF